MKYLLVAINAKYIHSNPGVYSLKAYAEANALVQGGTHETLCDLPPVHVEIGEYTINNQMEQILEDIYKRKPEVVGFSCYIWNITHVLNLVHDLHKVLPDTDIWLGGPEVSFDAAKLLASETEVFGIMKGEGEETFAGLLECYRKLGVSYRTASKEQASRFWKMMKRLWGVTCKNVCGEILNCPVRPVMDMNKSPFLYSDLEGFEHRIVYYESSRGCPFSCSYCLSSIDKSVRFRDVELVKRELDFFLKHKVPQVKFVDRTFNCNKIHAMSIWEHILAHDNGITNFHFEIAADLLDDAALELISRMRPGLIQLEIGVQSTNPDTIREIRRVMNLQELTRVVSRIREGHCVHQHLDLIVGLPYEDFKSFQNSFNQVYAMKPEQLQLGFLKVLKGSYMEEKAEEYGLTYRSLPPYEVLSTRWLSFEEVLRLKAVEDMVEIYYNSGQFTRTLELLETVVPDAYALFEALADYYEEKDRKGQNHSRLSRYEFLYEFIREKVVAILPEEAVDALMYDVYLRENSKSRPSFAPDFTKYKMGIRRQHPELHALGTQVHTEVMNSGELVIFDYRKRDPLTGNATVTKEEYDGEA